MKRAVRAGGQTLLFPPLIADAINDAFAVEIDPDFIRHIALETLRLEAAFNTAAGFDEDDDEELVK